MLRLPAESLHLARGAGKRKHALCQGMAIGLKTIAGSAESTSKASEQAERMVTSS